MFGLGPLELMVIMLIVVLLFGTRVPAVARSLGESIRNFKRGLHAVDIQKDIDEPVKNDSESN